MVVRALSASRIAVPRGVRGRARAREGGRGSGEDIRGDARARSPHGLCGHACTAGGSHEADTCVRVEAWFVVRANMRW
mgnify:CR=1 FL=1